MGRWRQILLVLLGAKCTFAAVVAVPGQTIDQSTEIRESLYDQLSRAVIRLEHREVVYREGASVQHVATVPDGTAFFVLSEGRLYVVSARHVAEKEYNVYARVQLMNLETGANEILRLDLPRTGWMYHPNQGDKDTHYVDVAVMRIPISSKHRINCFRYEPPGSAAQAEDQLSGPDPEPPVPMLVFGFPSTIGFKLAEQKPLGRAGIISMSVGTEFLQMVMNNSWKFAEQRCCLIDARMFPGNSGSPVLAQLHYANQRPQLLGLVTAADTSLDFGVIEPVSRIRETIALARTQPTSGTWKTIPGNVPEPTAQPAAEEPEAAAETTIN